MATSVIPKSEFRRDDNIRDGVGEVPSFICEETGRQGWGMLNGEVTYCENEARKFAGSLDREIRRTMKHPGQLLTTVD